MNVLVALTPAVPLLVAFIMALWAVAGWMRIHRLARYYQECLYDTKRYSHRLVKMRRERREMINAFANLLSTVLLAVLASQGRYTVPGVAAAVALYSGFLALIDISVRPFAHHRGYTAYLPIPRTTRLIHIAYVIEALPLIVYLIVLVMSLFTDWDRLLIAFWGAATGAFALLLTPLALPVANLMLPNDDMLVGENP